MPLPFKSTARSTAAFRKLRRTEHASQSAGILGTITTLLGSLNLNIAQQLNTSRDDIAYNVVDLQDFPEGEAAVEVQQKLLALDGVLSTRIIWTGSVMEGPSSFYTKA